MDLVVIEMLSLVVVLAVLVGNREASRRGSMVPRESLTKVALCYLVYLVVSIITHLQMLELFPGKSYLDRLVFVVHTVTIPLLVLVWMVTLERELLPRAVHRVFVHGQAALWGLFALAALVDLGFGRLYRFSTMHAFVGGYGVLAMLWLGIGFTLVVLAAVVIRWGRLERYSRLVYLITSLFMVVALGMFIIFRQPDMFTFSSTFFQLLSHLLWQRR